MSGFIVSLRGVDLDYKINSDVMRSRKTLMMIEPHNKIDFNSNTRLIYLVFGLPIAGLIYCGLGIAGMATFSIVREHALISGTVFFLLPFSVAASIWISASAQAYRH